MISFKSFIRTQFAVLMFLLLSTRIQAAPISIYTAPDQTYQNATNNPCLFFGPGLSGCSQDPSNWPAPVGDTGGGSPFTPNPLVFSFTGANLLAFRDDVGAKFILGLDINDTSTPQTLSNVTINVYNLLNVNVASYSFTPPTSVPSNANGVGFADYVLSAGCNGTTVGTGVLATCTNYAPFSVPTVGGVSRIDFTFGLTGFNDGPDKLFLIEQGGPIPTPFCVGPDCDLSPVPEPASLVLLGSGILGLVTYRYKRTN